MTHVNFEHDFRQFPFSAYLARLSFTFVKTIIESCRM